MIESRNIFDLLGKIEWEGGIAEVLEYGLRTIDLYDVPDSLKEHWEDMVSAYDDFQKLREIVEDEMLTASSQYSEDKEF